MTKKIIIEKKVFDKFPSFNRGLVIVSDIENGAENKEIEKLLREQIGKVEKEVLENELVTTWDEIYRELNVNPNKFPPSIKSLLKRVCKGGNVPFINSVVALFNYISLKYLIPCGGDDVDTIEGNLKLGIANGSEKFTALGSTEVENPDNGEVIYYDDKTLNIMCRRWNWRNGDFSKITPNTKKIVINVDGIGPADESVIIEARDELASLLTKCCNAKVQTDLLNAEKSEILVEF